MDCGSESKRVLSDWVPKRFPHLCKIALHSADRSVSQITFHTDSFFSCWRQTLTIQPARRFCQYDYFLLPSGYKQTPRPESANDLYRPRDRRLSAKVVPTFTDKACRVLNETDLYGRILRFLDQSRYYFFQVAPQLYSRGWVDQVPYPVLLRKSGSSGNRTRASGSVARPQRWYFLRDVADFL
jgi:hypothetical protein